MLKTSKQNHAHYWEVAPSIYSIFGTNITYCARSACCFHSSHTPPTDYQRKEDSLICKFTSHIQPLSFPVHFRIPETLFSPPNARDHSFYPLKITAVVSYFNLVRYLRTAVFTATPWWCGNFSGSPVIQSVLITWQAFFKRVLETELHALETNYNAEPLKIKV